MLFLLLFKDVFSFIVFKEFFLIGFKLLVLKLLKCIILFSLLFPIEPIIPSFPRV